MDHLLIFTQRALNDLLEIVGYIAEDSPDSAFRFGNSLLDHVDLLRRYPRMGTLVPDRARVRKLVHSPIIIYYRIDEQERTVEVLHFRHASRQEPKNIT